MIKETFASRRTDAGKMLILRTHENDNRLNPVFLVRPFSLLEIPLPVISRKEEKMLDAKEIGQRVKKIRTENQLTQQEFGESIGVTLNTVSKIEPGMRMPSIDLMAEIAVKYSINLNWLMLGIGNMQLDS